MIYFNPMKCGVYSKKYLKNLIEKEPNEPWEIMYTYYDRFYRFSDNNPDPNMVNVGIIQMTPLSKYICIQSEFMKDILDKNWSDLSVYTFFDYQTIFTPNKQILFDFIDQKVDIKYITKHTLGKSFHANYRLCVTDITYPHQNQTYMPFDQHAKLKIQEYNHIFYQLPSFLQKQCNNWIDLPTTSDGKYGLSVRYLF
jgi:hypothetical protein